MKSLPALLLLGASVLPTFACDSADAGKASDLSSAAHVAGAVPGTAKADTRIVAPAPQAPLAPAPNSPGKPHAARRAPLPAHLFM